jgi:Tfp pilus assembly protein PilX
MHGSTAALRSVKIDTRGFANEKRRRILAQQAEAALPYYEENKAEWEEWINLDIAETYAS